MKFFKSCPLIVSVIICLSIGTSHAAGDPEKGKQAFAICSACHSVVAGSHGIGPNLASFSLSSIGQAEGFAYSPAFKKLAGEWTEEDMISYLANPMAKVPGTMMAMGAPSEQAAKDILAYLQSLNTK